VDPTGKFLYVVNQTSNNISGYTTDPMAGTLTPIPGSPFLAGVSPVSVTVDVSGSYVYVVNSGNNTVSAFSVNTTTGALTPVAGSPFAAETAPISVVTTGKVQ
jgi:6-phosphogluconolactonase (cycloisomerase 2 family)